MINSSHKNPVRQHDKSKFTSFRNTLFLFSADSFANLLPFYYSLTSKVLKSVVAELMTENKQKPMNRECIFKQFEQKIEFHFHLMIENRSIQRPQRSSFIIFSIPDSLSNPLFFSHHALVKLQQQHPHQIYRHVIQCAIVYSDFPHFFSISRRFLC